MATLLAQPLTEPATGDVDARVLRAVQQDPFSTITEIRREINRQPGAPMIGWWRIFGILRRHGLLRRRARFHYARRHW